MDKKHLLNCLKNCDINSNILVIGDIMLDEYHWCDVSRISPEAPVPVCKVNKTTLVPGGAANVAYNITTLNNQAMLVGSIGNDSSGLKLNAILNDSNINLFTLNEFKKMKKDAILINTSRGEVINEKDLLYALKNKLIYGAGLDVLKK